MALHGSIPHGFPPWFDWLLWFRPRVEVGKLDANLARISALAIQSLPCVTLPPSRNDYILKIYECFADEFRLLVIVEDRDLEGLVIEGVVDSKAEFLVPVKELAVE